MTQVVKRFRSYAVLVIFILLTLLLGVINGINFTMAAEDADRITQMLAEQQGIFERNENAAGSLPAQDGREFRMGPMGPSSPDVRSSVRYFTIAFSDDGGQSRTVAFQISAVTEEEAVEWARSLSKETAGWTKGTYRYRVWHGKGLTYVTVIDQGRELLPSYRILLISAIGEVLTLVISWFALLAIGRKIYAPLEEADRKQKNFMNSANRELRLPLTVMSGNVEMIERNGGPNENTRALRRQLERLYELTRKIDRIGLFRSEAPEGENVSLSEVLSKALEENKAAFEEKGLALETDIKPDVVLTADPGAMELISEELIRNALKFARGTVSFTLDGDKGKGRITLETANGTELPDGPADQIFDRFTTLANAAEDDTGMGLATVKEIVRAHGGRVTAAVKDGTFTLRIAL